MNQMPVQLLLGCCHLLRGMLGCSEDGLRCGRLKLCLSALHVAVWSPAAHKPICATAKCL